MEGPFINPEKKGAHLEQFIQNFDNGFCDVENVYGSLENVAIITLAPELPNGVKVISELKKKNVAISIGT